MSQQYKGKKKIEGRSMKAREREEGETSPGEH